SVLVGLVRRAIGEIKALELPKLHVDQRPCQRRLLRRGRRICLDRLDKLLLGRDPLALLLCIVERAFRIIRYEGTRLLWPKKIPGLELHLRWHRHASALLCPHDGGPYSASSKHQSQKVSSPVSVFVLHSLLLKGSTFYGVNDLIQYPSI